MISYTSGDLMKSKAEALVNTVNTVGVMGKGIALQFKKYFPENYEKYRIACGNKELAPGTLLGVWETSPELGRKFVINFPTKIHWKNPSQYDYIKIGLVALKELLAKEGVGSIAIPPLGCGNGGLQWSRVKPMIAEALSSLNTDVYIYEPFAH